MSWNSFGLIFKAIVIAFFVIGLAVVAVLLLPVILNISVSSHHHGEQSTCPTSDIPKAERKLGVTKCVTGSPVTFRKGTSRVEPASRTDSRLIIHGIYKESMGIARGCGRKWTVVDTARFPGAGVSRDTGCNLKGHTTARKNRFGNWVRDSEWARHPR